jgi:outer membrane protein OmpA-like peptidoglycan-associated protein
VNVFYNDFRTAALIRKSSLGEVLNENNWSRLKDMYFGVGVEYLQGIGEHVDFAGRLDVSFPDYIFRDKKPLGSTHILIEADANVHVKLLSDKYFFTPYVTGGVGASMYKIYFAAYMPVGLGFQFNLGKGNAFIFTEAQYRLPVTELGGYHFNYSLGFAGALTHKKEKAIPPPPAPVVQDSDSDGVYDDVDKCPQIAGLAKYNGCPVPDTDGDGVNDEEDKCPQIAGLPQYGGCPIPDTDGDGIDDEKDACVTVPGVARYNGCPVPDTDGDGVNDEEDKCPSEVGPISNQGCPEKIERMQAKVNLSAQQIYFNTGSAVLLRQSFTPLNEVVAVLKENADLNLLVEGHTDNTGSSAVNKRLSQQRADAVKKYLVQKGIAAQRITTIGYGAAQPVASNATAEGRSKNRRVELKLQEATK